MKYFNDPLLTNKKFYIKEKTNLYSCLINLEDFSSNVLKNVPYVILNNTVIDKLTQKLAKNDYARLLESLVTYLNIKYPIKSNMINVWLKKYIVPFPLLRVASLLAKDESILTDVNKITHFQFSKIIKLPLRREELLDPKLIYLAGCITGDGCICKNHLIKIVDGHSDKNELSASLEFLEKLGGIFKEVFACDYKIFKKPSNNQYELYMISKWLTRFFNFFFEIDYSPKKKIRIPRILENDKLRKYFLRGLFDTDGGIHKNSKFIVYKSFDENFIKKVADELKSLNIEPSEIKEDSGIFYFSIYAADLKLFAQKIGFSHPRKLRTLLSHLSVDTWDRAFKGVNESCLINGFFDIEKIKDLRILGVGDDLKKIRNILGMTQQKIADKLRIRRRNYSRYENNELGVPFKTFLRCTNFINENKLQTFEKLYRRNIRFGYHSTNFIYFPINMKDLDINLIKALTPTTDRVIIRKRHKGRLLPRAETDKLIKKSKNYFDVDISKSSRGDFIICSSTLSKILTTFFDFSPPWKKMSDAELDAFEQEMTKIWM